MNSFLDKFYTDGRFLVGLVDALDEEKGQEYLAQNGIRLNADDMKRLDVLSTPGPDFDIRFAGGAYRFQKSSHSFWDLIIDSANRKIYGEWKMLGPKTVRLLG